MSDRDYCYPPDFTVLRNRLDIRDAPALGDVNHVHPFREGNGRTQLQYLKQLAVRAGHILDLTRINRAA